MNFGGRARGGHRGFTLIELAVVVAILSLLGGFAIFQFQASKEVRDHDRSARDLQGWARKARAIGSSGNATLAAAAASAGLAPPPSAPSPPSPSPSPSPPSAGRSAPLSRSPTPGGGLPVMNAGLQVIDATTVQMYATTSDGSRIVLDTYDMRAEFPNTEFQIVSPSPGSEVRFRKNGTRDMRFTGQIQIRSIKTGRIRTININAGGLSRIQ